MFDTTFFKFLIAFVAIIGISFLIMGITGSFDSKTNTGTEAPQTILN